VCDHDWLRNTGEECATDFGVVDPFGKTTKGGRDER
jgi:hypothetical protein